MNCQEFRLLLDDYIDGVLSGEDTARLLAHAEECPACRAELDAANAIRDDLAELNQEIDVPLAAQAAWRSAIRKEARGRAFARVVRVGTSVAAAIALLLGAYALIDRELPAETMTVGAQTDAVTPAPKAAEGEEETAADAGIAVAADYSEDIPAAGGEGAGVFAATRSVVSGVYTEIQSSVSCGTGDYEGTLAALQASCEAVGGRVVGVEESVDADCRVATVVVVVPADALDGFVAAAGYETGRHVTDISVDVAAYASRVELLRGSIAALEGEAENSEEAADTLARLQGELETAQGELASLRKRTGMARVMVTVVENLPAEAKTELEEE